MQLKIDNDGYLVMCHIYDRRNFNPDISGNFLKGRRFFFKEIQ